MSSWEDVPKDKGRSNTAALHCIWSHMYMHPQMLCKLRIRAQAFLCAGKKLGNKEVGLHIASVELGLGKRATEKQVAVDKVGAVF